MHGGAAGTLELRMHGGAAGTQEPWGPHLFKDLSNVGLHEELLQAKGVWIGCNLGGRRERRALAEQRFFRSEGPGARNFLAGFVEGLPSYVVLEAGRGSSTAGGASERRGVWRVTFGARRYHAWVRAGGCSRGRCLVRLSRGHRRRADGAGLRANCRE